MFIAELSLPIALLYLHYQTKKGSDFLHFLFLPRRKRDSNPRYIAVQRFSRPPRSTTLPFLRCKDTTFLFHASIFIKIFNFILTYIISIIYKRIKIYFQEDNTIFHGKGHQNISQKDLKKHKNNAKFTKNFHEYLVIIFITFAKNERDERNKPKRNQKSLRF